jgi:hypothetical protein
MFVLSPSKEAELRNRLMLTTEFLGLFWLTTCLPYAITLILTVLKRSQVYHNFIAHDIRPSLYLHPWIRSVYAYHLPLDCATRIFDILVLEGDSFLFRTGLALLQTMEARLFNPDKEELAELFRGEDKGAKAVIQRYRGNQTTIYPDEVYTQCGADEEKLFQGVFWCSSASVC